MAFDPSKYKSPKQRKESLVTKVIRERGYYIRECGGKRLEKKEDGKLHTVLNPDHVYVLTPECKGMGPVETVMTRSVSCIESKSGESLKDFLFRLGWLD